jgi:hypothetical protein
MNMNLFFVKGKTSLVRVNWVEQGIILALADDIQDFPRSRLARMRKEKLGAQVSLVRRCPVRPALFVLRFSSHFSMVTILEASGQKIAQWTLGEEQLNSSVDRYAARGRATRSRSKPAPYMHSGNSFLRWTLSCCV